MRLRDSPEVEIKDRFNKRRRGQILHNSPTVLLMQDFLLTCRVYVFYCLVLAGRQSLKHAVGLSRYFVSPTTYKSGAQPQALQ